MNVTRANNSTTQKKSEALTNPTPSDVAETTKAAETAPEKFHENVIIVEAVVNESLVDAQEKRNTALEFSKFLLASYSLVL